jgi:hypothetical protein
MPAMSAAAPHPASDPAVGARPLDLRRALLGHLVTASRPVDLDALVAMVVREFGDPLGAPAGRKRVADVLGYQCRLGRVRRVGRARYEYVPGSMARATAWRCVNWRTERDRAVSPARPPAAGTAA